MEVIALPVIVLLEPLQRVLVLVGEGHDDLPNLGGVLLAGVIMGLASAGLLGALSSLFSVG